MGKKLSADALGKLQEKVRRAEQAAVKARVRESDRRFRKFVARASEEATTHLIQEEWHGSGFYRSEGFKAVMYTKSGDRIEIRIEYQHKPTKKEASEYAGVASW